MPALTRGPLPARVYWFRRFFVFGSALLLVVAIARVLGGSSDASGGGSAELVGADASTSSTPDTASPSDAASGSASGDPFTPGVPTVGADETDGADQTARAKPRKRPARTGRPELPQPTGRCESADIQVTPEIDQAVAGRDVRVALGLRTLETAACTWRVSPDTLAVRITSGSDRIWSSRHCPGAIPRRDVVVRQASTTTVALVWKQAKRSDESCTARTSWALPGWYHVTAAALGGEPADVQFELTTPAAATVTVTAKPKQSPKRSPKQSPKKSPTAEPSRKPGQSPSGAVEPDGVR